LKSKSLV